MQTLTHPETGHQIARADVILFSLLGGIFYAMFIGAWRTVVVLLLACLVGIFGGASGWLSLGAGWLACALLTSLLVLAEYRARGYLPAAQAQRLRAKHAAPPRQARLAQRQADQYCPVVTECPFCAASIAIAPKPALYRCPDCKETFQIRAD